MAAHNMLLFKQTRKSPNLAAGIHSLCQAVLFSKLVKSVLQTISIQQHANRQEKDITNLICWGVADASSLQIGQLLSQPVTATQQVSTTAQAGMRCKADNAAQRPTARIV